MSDANLPNKSSSLSDALRVLRDRTPARVFLGRAGPAYRTNTQLTLRQDHAAALDAVHAEIQLEREFEDRWQLFEVITCAAGKADYLMRPDLGRRLNEAAQEEVVRRCPRGANIQVVLGDGLSAAAVIKQVPFLLPLLQEGARQREWTFGQPFLVRYCRVGVLNDIGELLDPKIVVLLIGERPGLATAESLSAYMAYQPQSGHTDAQRNLISNIHARGIFPEEAALRILALADKMRTMKTSGVAVKENLAGTGPEGRLLPVIPSLSPD